MDPLSATASLIAILGVARAGVKRLKEVHHSYRHAPREIADLISELERFQALIAKVKLLISQNERVSYNEGLLEIIGRASSTRNKINDSLPKLDTPDSTQSVSIRNKERLAWLMRKKVLIHLLTDLRSIRTDLVVQLSLLGALASSRTEQLLDVCLRKHDELYDQLTRESLPRSGSPRIDVLIEDSMPTNIDCEKREESDPTHRPSIVDEPECKSLLSLPTNLSETRCGIECSCNCHVWRYLSLPWTLNNLFGSLHVSYRSNIRMKCNEIRCKRPAINSLFTAKYQWPADVMGFYIALNTRYSPRDGFQLSLRLPRVTPWSHPLWIYAKNNDVQAIQNLFLKGKASPHDINMRGSNALIYAVGHKSLDLCKLLLQEGADPYLPNESRWTASETSWERAIAGFFGPQGICKLRAIPGIVDHVQRNFTVIHKIVLGFLSCDLASELAVTTAAVNQGDAKGKTPLMWATLQDDLPKVEVLLAYGADPCISDDLGNVPLTFIFSVPVLKALLKANANVNYRTRKYCRSVLHQFCEVRAGFEMPNTMIIEVIGLLVNAGIYVDIRDSDMETPLLNAIFSGLTIHVKRLIELGADVNAANQSGADSAIQFAVTFNRHVTIPLLLARGANYHKTNRHGRNIAHMAARSADARTLEILANSHLIDLDTTSRDKDGKTPAEYLLERLALGGPDFGLEEKFEKLLVSVSRNASSRDPLYDHPPEDTTEIKPHDPHSEQIRLPGAYPVGL